jgi:hypothetical protein
MTPEQAEAYRDAVEAYNCGADKEWLAFDAEAIARAAPHLPEVKALEAKLAMAVQKLRLLSEAQEDYLFAHDFAGPDDDRTRNAMAKMRLIGTGFRATLAKIGDK